MATYQHGVYNQEQATSLTTPIRSSAALQVIFGTAPVHLADDPTKAANTLKLCYSFAECQAAVGYSDDFKNFTLCQSKLTGGKLKRASTMDSGVTLNILYILIEVNGESVVELDKMNPTYKVNGVDLLAEYKEMC